MAYGQKAVVLESQLEYLSLSKPKRILYKFTHFFTDMPKKISRKTRDIPAKARKRTNSFLNIFKTIGRAMKYGDWKTRLSFIFMGLGQITRHQIIRGSLYMLFEACFIVFMIFVGGPSLARFGSLGYVASGSYSQFQGIIDITVPVYFDNSFTILLYSLLAIMMILLIAVLWYGQLKDALTLQEREEIGKYASDKQTLENVLDKSYAGTLLFLPIGTLTLFTILPMIMMILVAFTNYDYNHQPTGKLFDWVGMYNFRTVLAMTSDGSTAIFKVFIQVLLWTLIWAFFATFTNYFLGMIVAMIINIKGIKLKKVWRTVLITTIAVPQFISLLLVSQIFADGSILDSLLQQWGITTKNVGFLSDPILAKVMIILINTWVGIPYTMLICTGLLMNIPEDLYESARIDGASPARMYFKITLPYMLFVTGPYLISQFVGNINNFNVIFLLSGGVPPYSSTFVTEAVPSLIRDSGVVQTDLLITWIYRITTNKQFDYGAASVLSLLIFAVIAFFSLIFYNRSSAVQDEEAFQ